jgi:hypothetical protein
MEVDELVRVGYVCTGLAAVLLIATILSPRLQKALLLGQTGGVDIGKIALRGATGVIFLGILLGPSMYAGYLKRPEPELKGKIEDQKEEIDRLKGDNAALAAECDRLQGLKDGLQQANTDLLRENEALQREIDAEIPEPIDRVKIGVRTTAYSKSDREPVCFEISHRGRCLAKQTYAEGFPPWQTQQFELALRQPIPAADAGSIVFRVEKTPQGSSNGRRWDAQFDVEGVLEDRTTVQLISTPEVTIGAGMPPHREFVAPDREILSAEHCSLFLSVYVDGQRVTSGFLCKERGMVPIRDVAGHLGFDVNAQVPDRIELYSRARATN